MVLVGYDELGALLTVLECRDELLDGFVRYQSDDHSNRERDHAENKTDCPLCSVKTRDREGVSTDENDQDLPANNDELDANEPLVAQQTGENVEAIVQSARADKSAFIL